MKLLKIFHERSQSNLVHANYLLMGLLLLALVVVAFIPGHVQEVVNKILMTTIFFSSIYTLAFRLRIMFPIAILLTLVQWAAKVVGNDILEVIAGLLNITFFVYVVVRLVRQFVSAKQVSPLVILGSINGYLLLGLVYAIFTIIVSILFPGSYYDSHNGIYLTTRDDYHTFIYYTFITMTTVGYGDIVPVTSAARALAIFIAVSGQLYITVVLAFLVGKFASVHLSRTREKGKDEGGRT